MSEIQIVGWVALVFIVAILIVVIAGMPYDPDETDRESEPRPRSKTRR